MRCVICQEEVRGSLDDHVGVHLPIRETEILEYFEKAAFPFKIRPYQITGADVRKGEILFSIENAKLFIGFAGSCLNVPWQECCEWLAVHEKSHLRLRELYSPPEVNPNIVSHVEDYYIEEYMMPKRFRQVYEAHVRLIVAIRNMTPLPRIIALKDTDARICYYLTFACWYASNLVTRNDMNATANEVKFIEAAGEAMTEVQRPEGLPSSILGIHRLWYDFC
jgi:hypothetical protein